MCGVVATLVNFNTNSFENSSCTNCQCQVDSEYGRQEKAGASVPTGDHLENCSVYKNRFGFIQTKKKNVATYTFENFILFLSDQGKIIKSYTESKSRISIFLFNYTFTSKIIFPCVFFVLFFIIISEILIEQSFNQNLH